MKSKILWFLLIGGCLIGLAAFFFFKKGEPKTELVTPLTSPLSNPTVEEVKQLTWNDQAGFAFQYPEGLTVDIHPEDDENYSHLDFSSLNNEGGLFILVSDTKYKDVEAWTKGDKDLTGGLIVDTTLGGKPAKKISFADTGKVIVGGIDEKILFRLETANSSPFWKNIFDEAVGSFEYVYPTQSPTAPVKTNSGSSSDSDIIEEEEILQ